MPRFRYKAAEPTGETVEGELEAANEAAVIASLRTGDRVPIRIVEVAADGSRGSRFFTGLFRVLQRPIGAGSGVAPRDIAALTSELAQLLRAGLALDRALVVIAAAATAVPLKALAIRLAGRVRRGQTLSAALEAERPAIPSLAVALVRGGEASGALPLVLEQYAAYAARNDDTKEAIRSALTYPCIVLVAAALSVIVLLVFVMPEFARMFRETGQQLPFSTRIVVGIAGFLGDFGWLLALGLVLAGIATAGALDDQGRAERFDGALLRTPIVGDLIVRLDVERLARSLAMLLGGGIPLAEALPMAAEAVRNRAFARAVANVAARVREGISFSAATRSEPLMPVRLVELALIADEIGRLDAVMGRVADIYRQDLERSLKRIAGLLEPALVLVLGVVIGAIVISIFSAIVGLNALAI
ncbi:MAG: type II secretion system F family protein [Alphaproteobacteria bacterium]|nr:type II secretion system F family protein [Alphaproteobacteria bacterium]